MPWIIAKRDWLAAFRDGSGWLLLAACQAILTWVLLNLLDTYLSPGATPGEGGAFSLAVTRQLHGSAAVLLLLLTPLLASRALAGAWRDGTDTLLASAPIGLAELLLGKLLGVAGLTLLVSLLPLGLCLTLLGAAPIDLGIALAATLGLWLLSLLFAAVGLFAASLAAQPMTATLLAYALLVALSLINRADAVAAAAVSPLDWLSWTQHLFWFLIGVARLSDLLYFGLGIGLCLALAHRQLDNRRDPP